jgi:light-regulated signal transduction histidine kinase (bacteriophytochrome)
LALVKIILEAHGTVMRVESEEGEGSAFSFPLLIVHGSE